jgi:hypothetical protein
MEQQPMGQLQEEFLPVQLLHLDVALQKQVARGWALQLEEVHLVLLPPPFSLAFLV